MEMLNRVTAILLTPHTEWPVIAQEKGEVSALFIRYLVNRDRYTGVNGYIYREIMPYIMRKLPFLYFCVKKR